MALVNVLRFNEDCGAAVSDEEFWNIFFRRRLYCDNLHPLLDDETGPAWGMEVVYGGTGYPALHHEVLAGTRKRLVARMALAEENKASPPTTVREIARIAFDELVRAVRRRIDVKLQFFYGLDTAAVNRASVTRDGASYPIANAKVMDALRALASGDKKDALLRQVFESRAVIFGFDGQVGMTAYHLSPENYICGYVHEGFECIGTGKYASGLSLGKDFRTRTLMMRKAGYPAAEGLFELLASALVAKDHFKEVGGNINFVLLDRKGNSRAERYREVFDDEARLAGEIVKAQVAGLLDRADAVTLLEDLVFGSAEPVTVEKALFGKVANPEALTLVLRGYKLKEVPLIAGAKTGRKKGGKK